MRTPASVVAGVDFGDAAFAAEVRDGVARIEDLMSTELGKADELMADAKLQPLKTAPLLGTGAEVAKVAEGQFAEAQAKFSTLVDTAAKNAPAGTENAPCRPGSPQTAHSPSAGAQPANDMPRSR